MNRKFRRKRLALSTGVDQLLTPNYSNLNQLNSLKARHSITSRQQFLFYRWLLILLVLGPLIGLVKYANSQTATDLLVAPSRPPPDSSVNTFFQNGHLLENHHFTSEFPDLATQSDQLVTTVQHLNRNKNTNQPQKPQASNGQRNPSGKPPGRHTVTSPSTSSAVNSESVSNKNRSARTSQSRNDNARRLKQADSKKKNNNSTDSGLSSSLSPSLSSAAQSATQSAAQTTTSKSANQSPNQSASRPATTTTNKQSNEQHKQSETTKSETVNSSANSAKLNESKADTRPASVAGSASHEKSDLNLEEIAEESLKIESIGSSSVEYITDDKEKRTAAAGEQPSSDSGDDSTPPNTSNDLLHTGYKLANLEGESSLEIKDVYTDSQSEYLFNHQPLPHKMQYESEIQRLDGWNNNLGHLHWGSIESQLSRKVASNYADGVYMVDDDLPSARLLSQSLMRGEDGQSSSRNLTVMFALFGQVVSSEILMASESGCPIEYHAIKIEKCDPMFDRNCKGGRTMPFHRAIYDLNTGQSPNSPREQLNMVTSWIDGSFVYSTYETWLNVMRSFRNGTLKIDPATGYPPKNTKRVPLWNSPPAHHFKMISPERMFLLGDARTNQNPALLSFAILFYKYHNLLASRIQANNPSWNDEDVFQRARRLLIASMQNIILYEYLPIFLEEKIPKYEQYKPDLHPGVSHSFQSAAFRFGHTMIPPGLYMRDANCNFKKTKRGYSGLRLCASWWNSDEILDQIEMEELLMGLSSQLAEKEDAILCSDVRDKLFGPMNFSRRDLAALNIMRGRDNGLADYMTVREAFGLPRLNWTEILPKNVRKADFEREAKRRRKIKKTPKKTNGTSEHTVEKRETKADEIEPEIEIKPIVYPDNYNDFSPLEKRLFQLYRGDINSIDVYVGGMLESDPAEGRPGPLFRKIILEQFLRLRDSDRFWFENTANNLFSKDEIEEIKRIRLYDILVNTTSIPAGAVQKNVFQFTDGSPCPQPSQIRSTMLEPCLIHAGWTYFHGSEIIYVLVTLSLIFVPIVIGLVAYGVIKLQNRIRRRLKAKQDAVVLGKNYDKLYVKEWLDPNHKRYVKVKLLSSPEPALYTTNRKNEILRKIDFTKILILVVEITIDCNHKPMILIPTPKDHDLVLQFQNTGSQKKFLTKLEHFLLNQRKVLQIEHRTKSEMLANAETKEKRQKRLEHFFREAYSITFGLKKSNNNAGQSAEKYTELNNNYRGASPSGNDDVIMVMKTSLSKQEFAEALGMRIDSLFVKQMFNCVDKDKDGRISFQEFLDTVVLFTRGKAEDKLRIIFDMCDYDGTGVIEKSELQKMLTSLVDIAKTSSMSEDQVYNLIEELFAEAGLQDKKELTYDDFKLMMKDHKGNFIAIGLDLKGAKQNFLSTSKNIARMTSFQISAEPEPELGYLRKKWNTFATYLEENRQNIVYLLVFFVICSILFVERFVTYCFLSEHQDLRHIMGPFIALTRGSASALSFCYALLLLTMSRNLITRLRETSIHQYIPLDSHVAFHKICAMTALFFTILHCVGHIVNFYHISQQSHENLKCLGIFFFSDNKPNFGDYIFMTIPGFTGLALFIIVCLIFIFAYSKVRMKAYSYFWTVHQLYVLFYLLTLLHGMAKITGTPRFWIFFIIPAIVFTLDKILSLQTKYIQLDILEAKLLPSDVTKLKFSRPPNFKYLSGQWIRLACTAFRPNEYHSFTLTSAPHQAHLSVHVKATGVWTNKLRNYFHPNNQLRLNAINKSIGEEKEDSISKIDDESHRAIYHPVKIKIEGPFGGGNQDWYKYEIAVMIGGGIGVTPYASILNDLVFGTSTNRYSGVACKKVYFLWVCSSHKSFEWFIDVLRDVERKDVTQVLEIHIFITQFFHKFDLRTTMLYICENHFQRLSNKSMFTGLKAVNHFGRPDLEAFLKFIQKKHSYVSKVGVFSCGPTTLTKTISTACETVNNQRKLPYFLHQFENF